MKKEIDEMNKVNEMQELIEEVKNSINREIFLFGIYRIVFIGLISMFVVILLPSHFLLVPSHFLLFLVFVYGAWMLTTINNTDDYKLNEVNSSRIILKLERNKYIKVYRNNGKIYQIAINDFHLFTNPNQLAVSNKISLQRLECWCKKRS